MDAAELTLTQASRAIAQGKLSPVELLDAVLVRLAEVEPQLNATGNATGTMLDEQARASARAAERDIAHSGPRGPLHGIPVSIKEIADLAGLPTLAGSAARAAEPSAYLAGHDAVAVRRLREAGAVPFATSRSHELAYGITTPQTRNPWRTDRSPGGSSGGAAALVAARCGPVALGTDTAGSVRIPAAVCGVVGLKPTPCLVSSVGIMPLAQSLDTVGPLGRTVDDTAAMLAVLAGTHSGELALGSGVPGTGPSSVLSGLRVGVPTTYFFDGCDREIAAAVQRAITTLTELGAQTREVALANGKELAVAGGIVVGAEAHSEHRRHLEETPEALTDEVRQKLTVGRDITAADYLDALHVLRSLSRRWELALADIDVLVSPTLPTTARPFGAASTDPDQDPHTRHTRLTQPANLTGRPAITVPCGLDSAGIPIGLQLLGQPRQEATMLAVARAFEATTDWPERIPPVADAPLEATQ